MPANKNIAAGSRQATYGEPAMYIPSENPMYRFNPYIEALHPPLTPEKAISLMRRNPVYSEEMRSWSTIQRCHQVQEIAHFILPLPELIDLEERFSRMIRNGYMARNPLPPMWLKQLQSGFPDLDFVRGGVEYIPKIRPNASGFNILGLSGAGKSTAVESVLSTYTQVIEHTVYQGIPFDRKQLVWVKLECPSNGSTRSLCLDFFRTVDRLLGTRYAEVMSKRRLSMEDLMQAMPTVAECQGLGVLIVDEIHRLNVAHCGGAIAMLQFFIELSNKIGVPVVLIGTYEALRLFQSDFALARRSSGQGDMLWTNMAQDEAWDFFVESLWKFQWTKTLTPLTPALRKELYSESFGIIDIVVKLYMLAQWEVIGADDETITPTTIRTVAREKLKIVRPLIMAAKKQKLGDLAEMQSALPDKKQMEQYLEGALKRIYLGGTLNTLRNQSLNASKQPKNLDINFVKIANIVEMAGYERKVAVNCARQALENHPNDSDIKLAVRDALQLAANSSTCTEKPYDTNGTSEKNENPATKQQALDSADLREIVKKAKKGTSNYDALKNAAVICDSCEFE